MLSAEQVRSAADLAVNNRLANVLHYKQLIASEHARKIPSDDRRQCASAIDGERDLTGAWIVRR
jgi:hypothetical protein